MNRIVLIGNGFDLAHGLPTRYEDFINWYWDQRVEGFRDTHSSISKDILCEFRMEGTYTWNGFYNQIISPIQKLNGKVIIDSIIHNKYGVKMGYSFSPFFGNIIKSIETKGWVDIENEYYKLLTQYALNKTSANPVHELNNQLHYIQIVLAQYLVNVSQHGFTLIDRLMPTLYAPISTQDLSIESSSTFREHIETCMNKKVDDWTVKQFSYNLNNKAIDEIDYFKRHKYEKIPQNDYPRLFMLPDIILFVNFNYTNTLNPYINRNVSIPVHIHGELANPNNMIFGYGDEMDEKYKELKALNENECLKNIKSIKYLESENYRRVLSFLEAAPYQVLIMGHSCGNSDRTLLNTIFEHKNCISIKPYYYQKPNGTDNYLDIVQNISRNFNDMKLMRDRVVNKTFCEPLAQAK